MTDLAHNGFLLSPRAVQSGLTGEAWHDACHHNRQQGSCR
jgi:hypothetical protein